MAYCVIGASCTSIPLREINTYLASQLFGKFSVSARTSRRKPMKKSWRFQHWQEMLKAFLTSTILSIMNCARALTIAMLHMLMIGKFVRDYGNKEMVTSYTNQTASKLNFAEKNAKSMTTAGNKKSLIGRVDAQMRNLIRNINYGPMFAYGLVSAARSHNLLNVIGWSDSGKQFSLGQEAAQTSLRQGDYDRAKSDFDNRRKRSLFDTDAKRFGDYEYYLMLAEQHKLAMSCYEKLDQVLDVFRKQLEELTASYYIKLSRVVDTLVNTFKEKQGCPRKRKDFAGKGRFFHPDDDNCGIEEYSGC